MKLFRLIWLSCEKATFLITKKEEGKLTLIESVQLKLHLGICDFCIRFSQQTKFFTGRSKHLHEHSNAALSPQKKQAIQSLMKD